MVIVFGANMIFLIFHTIQISSQKVYDKGMGGRYVDFLYTICRYIATIHTDIVDKLTRSVEIFSRKNGHYFLNRHYLYKDRLYLLVRQDLLKQFTKKMAMIFLINTICIKIDSICCSTIIVGNLVPTDRLYLSICCSTLIVGNLVV